MFHEYENIRQQAKAELENYFQMIAQATFHDLYDIDATSTTRSPIINKLHTLLKPPHDQDLRKIRHHMHCQDLHGVIGYYPHTCDNTKKT